MSSTYECFVPDLKTVLRRAVSEARQRQHRLVEPEHILLALTRVPGPARYLRWVRGLDPVQLYRQVSTNMRTPGMEATTQPRPSERTKVILKLTVAEARRLSDKEITVLHLLSTIVRDEDSGGSRVSDSMRVIERDRLADKEELNEARLDLTQKVEHVLGGHPGLLNAEEVQVLQLRLGLAGREGTRLSEIAARMGIPAWDVDRMFGRAWRKLLRAWGD